MKHGTKPMVIVEDDMDDCEILKQTLHEIGVDNTLRCFRNGAVALDYLKKTKETPFIIISDINMPEMDGIELRKYIIEDKILGNRKIVNEVPNYKDCLH